ncbi:immunoglobulin delta heavy chain [Clarias magur]|nr:immunoglobulin delta heavy chain [Clarias magur]
MATQQAPQSLFPVWQCGSSPDGFVTLGCVTRDLISADGLRFAWKDASGRALTNFVQYPAVIASGKYSSVSQARVSASDWDANKKFTCEVSNALGTKRADVQKPVVIVTAPSISISTSVNTTSNDINLICWLDGYHPKTINVDWGAGKRAIEKKFKNEEKKEFAMLSQISINTQQWNEGKEFTCSATHKTKTYSQTWSICKDHPNSEPRIQLEKPPLRAILTDTHVTTSCIVETVLQPTVSWLVNGYKKTGSGINSERQDESTVSNLTISVEDWTKSRTITCRAEHPCFKIAERTITIPETVQKPPTVVIRRSVADIGKRDSAVLECAASGLPSGELSVTFQANDVNFPEAQYVNLPEGQDTLVALFTIPGTHRTKSYRFTCEIQLSRSMKWKSDSIGKLFDDPSSELSVLSNEDKSASTTQKLLCYGTGLNPEIKWLPESVGNAKSEITMNSDGHVKVSSELSVPKQEWKRGTTFTCQVRDQGGLKTVQKSTSVCEVTPDHARSAQVYLFGPSISDRPEADPVLVTCLLLGYGLQDFSVNCKVGTAKVSSSVSKTENNINGTENVQWVLRVPAQRWKNYEKVSCEVKHPCSNAQTYTTSKTKDLAATLLLTSPTQTELDSGTATFICLASDFFPESHTFKWTHGMTNLDKKVKRTILSKENDTFTAMSILELTANEWIGSSSPVKCEFQHSAQNLSKEASYVSVDQQLPKVTIIPPSNEDILINRTGGLMCKAEGPEGFTGIKWFVNGKETASLPKEDVSRMTEITLTTSISYEEWTSGTKFTCEVYHSAFAQGFIKEDYRRQHDSEGLVLFDLFYDGTEMDYENRANTALIFVFLFLITLFYSIGVTVIK